MGVLSSRSTFFRKNLRYRRLAKLVGLTAALVLLILRFQAATEADVEVSNVVLASNNYSQEINNVATSEEFQAALNAARPGDTITLQAGTVLRGNFVLPDKDDGPNGSWITVRSDGAHELAEGVRVGPANGGAMARLESPNTEPVLRTRQGAHHYRFIAIELTIAPNVMLNYGLVRLGDGSERDASMLPHHLVFDRCYIHGHPTADLSRGIALNSARTDILNSYISDCHGLGFDTQAIAGWNGSGPFVIVNNYLEGAGENVLFGGADPSIDRLVPSDIEFRNNHCAKPLSWMEGILSKPSGVNAAGGSAAGGLAAGTTYYYRVAVRGRAGYSTMATSAASEEISVTLDAGQTSIELSWPSVDHASEARIYRTSDAPSAADRSWVFFSSNESAFVDLGDSVAARTGEAPPNKGTRWSVKNLFELKNASRVLIDGNVFENNWVDAQSGFGILLTVRNQDGSANWSVVEDVSFTNNLVRHSAGGINLLGRDDLHPSEQVKRIEIVGNLFDDIGGSKWGGNGRFLQITETVDVRVDHNTVLQAGQIIVAYGTPNHGFVFTNNITPHNEYGIIGDSASSGVVTLDRYFPGSLMRKNVIVGGPSSRYPKKNYYPASLDEVGFVNRANGNYRLAESSPYKGAAKKNRDVGADFEALEAAASRAIQGTP